MLLFNGLDSVDELVVGSDARLLCLESMARTSSLSKHKVAAILLGISVIRAVDIAAKGREVIGVDGDSVDDDDNEEDGGGIVEGERSVVTSI